MSSRIDAPLGSERPQFASWIVACGSCEPVASSSATALPAVATTSTARSAGPQRRRRAAPAAAMTMTSGPMKASSLKWK